MENNSALDLMQLIYTSAATKPFSNQDLFDLLAVARRNNHSVKVSGILVYSDGSFLQVLEGPKIAVEAIYERVKTDPRHHSAALVRKQLIDAREFGEWSMAYNDTDSVAKGSKGYVDYLRDLEKIAEGDGAAQKILRGFFEGRWRSVDGFNRPEAA